MKPYYEWEGYHDGPELEALFADQYLASHPGGPFTTYLPLLAAHRWLCAADAYKNENKPADAARTHKLYEQRIASARNSADLMIRTAAEELIARNRCR